MTEGIEICPYEISRQELEDAIFDVCLQYRHRKYLTAIFCGGLIQIESIDYGHIPEQGDWLEASGTFNIQNKIELHWTLRDMTASKVFFEIEGEDLENLQTNPFIRNAIKDIVLKGKSYKNVELTRHYNTRTPRGSEYYGEGILTLADSKFSFSMRVKDNEIDFLIIHPKEKQMENKATRISNAAVIANEATTTARIIFQDKLSGGSPQSYIYRIPKSLTKLVKGDFVVVESLNTYSKYIIGEVVEVHDESEIDLDNPYILRWIITRIDPSHIEYFKEQDEKFIAAARNAERERLRAQVKSEFLLASPEVEDSAGK